MIFNLIPTEPDEYKIYADWLEDQGVILTASIRKGIMYFDVKRIEGRLTTATHHDHHNWMGYGDGDGCGSQGDGYDRFPCEGEGCRFPRGPFGDGIYGGEGEADGSIPDYSDDYAERQYERRMFRRMFNKRNKKK